MEHCLHLEEREEGGIGQPVPVRGTRCREKRDDPAQRGGHSLPQGRPWEERDSLISHQPGTAVGGTRVPSGRGGRFVAGGGWVAVKSHSPSPPPQPRGRPAGWVTLLPSFPHLSSPPPDTAGVSPHSRARPHGAHLRPGPHPPLGGPAQHPPDLWGPSSGGAHPGCGCPLGLPGLQGGEAEEEEEGGRRGGQR